MSTQSPLASSTRECLSSVSSLAVLCALTLFLPSIHIAIDSTHWADTTRFPCKLSQIMPSPSTCDYFVHGWQTVPGDSHMVLEGTDSDPVPQCCPEGIVKFTSTLDGTCNSYLSDSRWRVMFDSSNSAPGLSSLTFDVDELDGAAQLFPGGIACDKSSLDEIRLYLSANASASLTSVLVAGQSVSYAILSDPDTFVSIPSGFAVGSGAKQIVLQFSSDVSPANVCSASTGSSSVCPYVFLGSQAKCCTRGDLTTTSH